MGEAFPKSVGRNYKRKSVDNLGVGGMEIFNDERRKKVELRRLHSPESWSLQATAFSKQATRYHH